MYNKLGVKSCYNCINGIYQRGYPATYFEPEEPDMAECNIETEEIYDFIDEMTRQYDKLSITERRERTYEEHTATHCKHYNPQIALSCHVCQKTLNTPVYNTLLAVGCITGDEFAVCSQECKTTHEQREQEAEDQLFKDIEELENNPID